MKTNTIHIPTRWASWGFLPVCALLLILFRSFTLAPLVFPEDGSVRFSGNDPFFQVRHAEYAAQQFPELLRLDPGSHYPSRVGQQEGGLFNLGSDKDGFLATYDAQNKVASIDEVRHLSFPAMPY